ncbi:hypothetical protein GCM10012286_28380 [Streptomyces lasiicapitis]|uniref:Subtilisin inhibitor domain-containing protein n=1 Tax=Streptomyces lasiicapitis TaxID=1923961 RepID=A0ABQ2LVJ0_9ACTN|nr:hypothetical protein GCM10012286_28380 [Streptomyces lasiicapitis]
MKPSTQPLAESFTLRRRFLLAVSAPVAALAAVFPAAAHACPADHPGASERSTVHQLTITVAGTDGTGDTGDTRGSASDGTYTLECGPTGAGGTHPSPDDACERLDQLAADGADPFAPVPRDAMCTEQYGGPETAYVTGTWQGRPVDASFSRTDGCRIARWNGLVPVLPAGGGA